ncbi:MAG: HAMP domain-containing sensor histidine kinase [Verrucomicrobiota bacterium]|nr:HAMP domain-containing sensor histidine kinase [Verrucomicrobiota bacterium]
MPLWGTTAEGEGLNSTSETAVGAVLTKLEQPSPEQALFPLSTVLGEADELSKTNLPAALAVLEKAVAGQESLPVIDQINLLWVYSDALGFLGRDAESKAIVEKASALLPRLRRGNLERGEAILAVLTGKRLDVDMQSLEAITYYEKAESFFRNELRSRSSPVLVRDLATTLEAKGDALYEVSKYTEGNAAYREAASLFESIGDKRRMARQLLYAGTSGVAQRLDVSMQETLDVLQVFKREGDRVGMGMVYQNMGYDYVKDPAEAILAFQHAIDLSHETGDILTEIASLAGLTEKLTEAGRYEAAGEAARTGLLRLGTLQNESSRAHMFRVTGLAAAHSSEPEFREKALRYLEDAGAIYKKQGNDEMYMAVLETRCEALLALGRPAEAATMITECTEWSMAHHRDSLPRLLRLKAAIEEGSGDYKSAVSTGKAYQNLLESGQENAIMEKLEKLRLQYQAELKSQEVLLLQKQNELNSSRVKEQQKQIALLEAQENHARSMMYLAFGAGTGAFIIIVILFRLFQQKAAAHKREKELIEQLITRKDEALNQYRLLQDNLQQLQDANLRLKELDEKRRELLGFAVHDMKNPLGGVRLSLTIIEEEWRAQHPVAPDAKPDQLLSLISSCRDSMDYMLELTEKILQAQVAESMNDRIHTRPCDPLQLIEQTLALNRLAAQGKNIKLLVHKADPFMVVADPQALREVLDNLVSNAVKYSFPNTVVTVSLYPLGAIGVIKVHDGGPGILPEDMPKLFKPFMKLSAKPTGGESSTGLGLNVVKSYIEAMNGKVYARTVESGGAEFIVELPLAV